MCSRRVARKALCTSSETLISTQRVLLNAYRKQSRGRAVPGCTLTGLRALAPGPGRSPLRFGSPGWGWGALTCQPPLCPLLPQNQFFITGASADGRSVLNTMGDAIVDRILRAHRSVQLVGRHQLPVPGWGWSLCSPPPPTLSAGSHGPCLPASVC